MRGSETSEAQLTLIERVSRLDAIYPNGERKITGPKFSDFKWFWGQKMTASFAFLTAPKKRETVAL